MSDVRDRITKLAATLRSAEPEAKTLGVCDMMNKTVMLHGGHVTPCMGDGSNGWTHCPHFGGLDKEFSSDPKLSSDFDKFVKWFPKCKKSAFVPK